MKPVLIFDGECTFCRMWIERWREDIGSDIEIVAYQSLDNRFPKVDQEQFKKAIHYIDSRERVFVGAAAVFKAFKEAGGKSWLWQLYTRVPLFGRFSEVVYQFVSRRRNKLTGLTRLFVGTDLRRPRYTRVRRVFFSGLFAVFAIAFASLWAQVHGLFGENGIVPAHLTMEQYSDIDSLSRFYWKPTLAWFSASDGALHLFSALGFAIALIGLIRWHQVCAALCFLLYLSLVQVGSPFLNYQWDFLLLEMSFLSIFWFRSVDSGIIWLFRFLTFRLMFSSGIVKLLSGDWAWTSLKALEFHFWSQPLPNPISYFADKLPSGVLVAAVALLFVVELGMPFLIFFFRKPRIFAFFAMSALQVAFVMTGNFGFSKKISSGITLGIYCAPRASAVSSLWRACHFLFRIIHPFANYGAAPVRA